jgi:hypothetical protein
VNKNELKNKCINQIMPVKKVSKRITSKRLSNKSTWEKFLKNKDSRKVLQDAWKHKNPQKHFEQAIKSLHKKYAKKI